MGQSNLPSFVFLDGSIIEKDTFYFSARLDALPEGEYGHGRMIAWRMGEWYFQDREYQVESVCIKRPTEDEPNRANCALERMSGKIGIYWRGEQGCRDEFLPGPEGSFGPMTQIAQIDGALYTCGVDSSVYKRHAGKWAKFNDGLNTKNLSDYMAEGKTLDEALELDTANNDSVLSIGGIDGGLYLSGMNGLLCYRTDGPWQRIERVTNVDLTKIKCVDKSTVYVAGSQGILLRGNWAGFTAINTGINDSFTCIEWYNGKLYLGGYKGVYVMDGGTFHRVDANQGEFTCVALNAYEDQIIVVGERWFLLFDGKDWKRIENPDNADVI